MTAAHDRLSYVMRTPSSQNEIALNAQTDVRNRPPVAMVSRTKVCAVIDTADVSFQKCWRTIEAIKEEKLGDPWRQHFADFQEDLARALLKLDTLYRSITQEKDALVARKNTLDFQWFRRRMKKLEHYREALREAVRIGKSLGDAFAWLLYQGEHHLL